MTIQPSRTDGEQERPVHLSDDELSAFINGEIIDPRERGRFTAHLDACAECRERLRDTRAVVSLLMQAEIPAPPRSFKLDPGMIRPAVVPAESWIVRAQPALRRLTAIAAALLLLIVAADALTNRGTGSGSPSTARDVATSLQSTSGGAAPSAANSSSSAAESSASGATPAAGFAAPATTAPKAASTTPQAQEHVATSVAGSPPVVAETPRQSRPSYWRLSEFAAAVVVVWLLFLTVALPRLQQRREPRRARP